MRLHLQETSWTSKERFLVDLKARRRNQVTWDSTPHFPAPLVINTLCAITYKEIQYTTALNWIISASNPHEKYIQHSINGDF